MNNNKKNITKKQRKSILKNFSILLIIFALVLGIFFSSWGFADNIRLGSDFNGYYSALVSVNNLNEEERADGQPNGDAKAGAKALNQRLNPMGNNQIIIEQAGANYLKVLSPIDAYQNETIFRNQIQKNGGIVLLNAETLADVQISGIDDSLVRLGINDYFSGATSTSVQSGNLRSAAISYKLNGSNFQSLFTSSSESESAGPLSLFILLDADGFYNDIRNYYNLISGDLTNRIEEFFNVIIEPMRTIYNSSETSNEVKEILYDLFYGQWDESTSSGVSIRISDSLIETNNRNLATAAAFERISDSFTYLSETSKYVYDSNAVTADFQPDGRYATNVRLWSNSGQLVDSEIRVDKLFGIINPILVNFAGTNQASFNENYWTNLNTNYFLFSGQVSESYSSSTTTAGYIDGSNLITQVDTYTKAEIGASLFNAAGQGFVFTVNSIATLNGTVTSLMLWLGMIFLIIIALCLIVYMAFFYRLLGLFTIIITLSIIGVSLLSLTWFNLTVGPETIISAFILVVLNIEIFSTLFENMKESYFLKQRGIKTSFNISIKENIGLASDIVVALLIPSMCMFWISSNAIRSMAIMLAMGSFFTLVFTILVGVITFSLIMNCQWFTSRPYLFALNTDFASQGRFILNYKIAKAENKIAKLSKKEIVDNAAIKKLEKIIKKLNDKILVLTNKIESSDSKVDSKIIEKLNKKIEFTLKAEIKKIDAKKNEKIEKLSKGTTVDNAAIKKLEDRVKTLNDKLSVAIKKVDDRHESLLLKNKEKLNKKIELYKAKIAKLNPEKNAKKIQKLNFKITETVFLRDDETQAKIEEEGQISTGVNEKLKIKTVERNIKRGAKLVSAFGIVTLTASLLVAFLVGLNFDYTFGGRTDYTLWGDNISTAYYAIEDELFDDGDQNTVSLEAKRDELVAEHRLFEQENDDASAIILDQTRVVSEYINFVYSDTYFVNYLSNTIGTSRTYRNHDYSVSYGDQFVYDGASSNQNWITLTVYTQNLSQSAVVKNMFLGWNVNRDQNISETTGFITKTIRPATMLWSLTEIAITIGAIILALVIYILIRFKWTYYIAMVVSILLAPVVMVAAITLFQVPLGNSAIIAIVSCILFAVISLFMIFGKARSLISSKDEKSLTTFFNQEIEILYETKTAKKQMKDEFFKLKSELRIKIKEKTLTKEEIKKLKLEFKEIKHTKKIEFRKSKKENKVKITRVGRQNNYLSEVLVKTFKFGLVRCLLLTSLYVLLGVLMIISMPTILSFGISIVIGTIVTSVFVLFVSLPLWIIFEQIRIRNKLARKRFINGLHVSNEEQIIEGIND